MAMAIMSAITALFGKFPGPLVYGFLYDLSCSRFRDEEGKTGECLQYDNDLIKKFVVKFAAFATIIPLVADVLLVYIVRKLNLYLEPPPIIAFHEEKNENEEEAETSV